MGSLISQRNMPLKELDIVGSAAAAFRNARSPMALSQPVLPKADCKRAVWRGGAFSVGLPLRAAGSDLVPVAWQQAARRRGSGGPPGADKRRNGTTSIWRLVGRTQGIMTVSMTWITPFD